MLLQGKQGKQGRARERSSPVLEGQVQPVFAVRLCWEQLWGQASLCQPRGAFLAGLPQLLLDVMCLNLPRALCQRKLVVVGHPFPPSQPCAARHPSSGWVGESRGEAELEVQLPMGSPHWSPRCAAVCCLPRD